MCENYKGAGLCRFEPAVHCPTSGGQERRTSQHNHGNFLSSIFLEHSSILGASCVQWNHFGTARSCWIAVGLKSGLLQIFDVSGLRTHSSKPNRILSRLQFKAECQNLSKESVASS